MEKSELKKAISYWKQQKRFAEKKGYSVGVYQKRISYLENQLGDIVLFTYLMWIALFSTGIKFSTKNFKINLEIFLLKRSIIGGNFTGYNKDSLENYRKCIFIIVNRILPILQNYKGKIYIYADKITLGKTNYVEKNISTLGSFIFQFKNSKNNLGIQIADLLSYQIRLSCINNESISDYLLNNTLNLDLQEEFEI